MRTTIGAAALRLAPVLWSSLLAVLMLGSALGPGFVLTYDMVWVPDLAVRGDFLGLGSSLPRAVPSDMVVALLDEVVPGMVLQKAVLVGTLVVAGAGAWRLVGPGGLGPGRPRRVDPLRVEPVRGRAARHRALAAADDLRGACRGSTCTPAAWRRGSGACRSWSCGWPSRA